MSRPAALERIAIWDWPVRLTHWAIALAFAALWWTGEHDQMAWHRRTGFLLLGLVVFRLVWGLIGSSTARFSGFVRGPRATLRYAAGLLRREGQGFVVGHNPMGAWSILAMLALLAAEIGFGLFAVDVDGIESGPLTARVSFEAGRVAAHWHHALFDVLLALVALHLGAVVFYLVVKRHDLISPMLRGHGPAPAGTAGMRPGRLWRLAAAVVVAAAVAVWIARGAPL